MERRNWSLTALKNLRIIDSLDDFDRANALIIWVEKYIPDENSFLNFDLELEDANTLMELFYRNIEFMKEHRERTKEQLQEMRNLKKFIPHSYS